jgi:hypothetical protein
MFTTESSAAAFDGPTDRPAERLLGEWLGQKLTRRAQFAVSSNGPLGVAAHEYHADPGPLLADPGRQLEPAKAGHDDIGDQDVTKQQAPVFPRGVT